MWALTFTMRSRALLGTFAKHSDPFIGQLLSGHYHSAPHHQMVMSLLVMAAAACYAGTGSLLWASRKGGADPSPVQTHCALPTWHYFVHAPLSLVSHCLFHPDAFWNENDTLFLGIGGGYTTSQVACPRKLTKTDTDMAELSVNAGLSIIPPAAFAMVTCMRCHKFKATGYSLIAMNNRMKKKFT
jgi:hypothetical protein